ncbi:MAG: hypothetical protein NDJ90_10980 [Oligoflexia bacterium]|nr:hypothetical protein [Oligoflexia bacterium]
MKSAFQGAAAPVIEKLQGGWYSGRCYTERDPAEEASGLITVIPLSEGGVKYIMPASSITEKHPDAWDEIDDEELCILLENTYAHRNQPAYLENGSLVSMLTYEILVGKLYLRQNSAGQFFVKMTNAQIEDENTARTYFYCRLDRKVRDLAMCTRPRR